MAEELLVPACLLLVPARWLEASVSARRRRERVRGGGRRGDSFITSLAPSLAHTLETQTRTNVRTYAHDG